MELGKMSKDFSVFLGESNAVPGPRQKARDTRVSRRPPTKTSSLQDPDADVVGLHLPLHVVRDVARACGDAHAAGRLFYRLSHQGSPMTLNKFLK